MFVESRTLVLGAFLSAALGAVQAQEAKAQARTAAVADGVSSVVGVAAGAPVNPLLPILGLAFKAATLQHAETLPETERPRAYALAAAGWQGSAAGNVCAVASVLSGGSFLPACVAVGVAWGWKTWNGTERERREAERCAAQRAAAGKSKLRCAFMRQRVERAAAPVPARTFIAAQDLVAP
jgi:hypothetical protein